MNLHVCGLSLSHGQIQLANEKDSTTNSKSEGTDVCDKVNVVVRIGRHFMKRRGTTLALFTSKDTQRLSVQG